ncbi:hypothetical protein B0T19DRAFT_77134 [Cercophora scortea]|uniref:Uncharacterized protein n=1 Tax=Cercophora scortea TaxID=314031 RepID=A0AAE0J785_9PEZI|nr:hypothetical protein B0T19DRAFT_77134 [Cercophora scortea]
MNMQRRETFTSSLLVFFQLRLSACLSFSHLPLFLLHSPPFLSLTSSLSMSSHLSLSHWPLRGSIESFPFPLTSLHGWDTQLPPHHPSRSETRQTVAHNTVAHNTVAHNTIGPSRLLLFARSHSVGPARSPRMMRSKKQHITKCRVCRLRQGDREAGRSVFYFLFFFMKPVSTDGRWWRAMTAGT